MGPFPCSASCLSFVCICIDMHTTNQYLILFASFFVIIYFVIIKMVTYNHRILKTRLPVRSAIYKQDTGKSVLRWVTTGEYLLLYVFIFFSYFSNLSFRPFILVLIELHLVAVNLQYIYRQSCAIASFDTFARDTPFCNFVSRNRLYSLLPGTNGLAINVISL